MKKVCIAACNMLFSKLMHLFTRNTEHGKTLHMLCFLYIYIFLKKIESDMFDEKLIEIK